MAAVTPRRIRVAGIALVVMFLVWFAHYAAPGGRTRSSNNYPSEASTTRVSADSSLPLEKRTDSADDQPKLSLRITENRIPFADLVGDEGLAGALFYRTAGNPQDKPVLLCHGARWNSQVRSNLLRRPTLFFALRAALVPARHRQPIA